MFNQITKSKMTVKLCSAVLLGAIVLPCLTNVTYGVDAPDSSSFDGLSYSVGSDEGKSALTESEAAAKSFMDALPAEMEDMAFKADARRRKWGQPERNRKNCKQWDHRNSYESRRRVTL